MADAAATSSTIADEILFKDVDGQFKVLRGGVVERWEGTGRGETAAAAGVPRRVGPPAAVKQLPALVDTVVAELKFTLAGPELQNRLRQIVLSRFKDVRDIIETREALVRPAAQGGLGLSAATADAVCRLLERRYQAFGETVRQELDQERQAIEANVGTVSAAPGLVTSAVTDVADGPRPLTPLPPGLAPATPPLPEPPPRSMGQGEGSQAPLVTPPTSQIPNPNAQIPNLAVAPKFFPPTPPAIPMTAPPVPPAPPVAAAERPRPTLVGPLEELQAFTLDDFRQLDSDPVQACRRIREKIMLLEKQSFAHKAAAIAAWRKSPLVLLYTQLAAHAMGAKLPLSQVAARAESEGQAMLRVAEFEAIADLNRTLRF